MTFAAPLLLIGLLAAGIPFLLHLLSSVRAQEQLFPTLRFLRVSMEKTARRRRIQHWLLLLLRAALLALLALAVAQPITEATGAWLGARRSSAVVVVDNSFSMAARRKGGTRLSEAKTTASALLGGDNQPALASLLRTATPESPADLSADLQQLRNRLGETAVAYGPSELPQRVARAIRTLRDDTASPRRALYLMTDLQHTDMQRLLDLPELREAKDLHLFVIDTADAQPDNVGITALDIEGRRVRDAVLSFTVSVTNAAPTDRTVEVLLRMENGNGEDDRRKLHLRAAGQDGATRAVRFYYQATRSGTVRGQVLLDVNDQLPADNIRRFCLEIGGRIDALLVRGQAGGGFDPAYALGPTLNPWLGVDNPWPINLKTIEAAALSAEVLRGVEIVYLAEVASFSPEQAGALADFVAAGGSAVFFAGPSAEPTNYAATLMDNAASGPIAAHDGLLPGRLGESVGQVGERARALSLAWVDMEHPLLEGLYPAMSDYLTSVVYRYWRLQTPVTGRTLIRLSDGQPLVMEKRFGKGYSVLVTSTASPQWTNFPAGKICLPMMIRAAMRSGADLGRDLTYVAGNPAAIVPGKVDLGPDRSRRPVVKVDLPAKGDETAPFVTLGIAGGSATMTQTERPGVYRWQLEGAGPDSEGTEGEFVVNPHGPESNLSRMSPEVLEAELRRRGIEHAYVGGSLEAVHGAAAADAEGTNWWDLLLVAVVFLLVTEAILSNRSRREELVPAHLNPKVAVAPQARVSGE